ncbi:MAG: FtsK/SpoIIIE domain-containing protein [Verrucomicrobia bacterium]|nr:FtsK/SpoIIIE domain-containing protein [Verrucomicrobiota bacterium]
MSNPLGVEQTLELLTNLESVVREFASREHQLNQDFHARIAMERRHSLEAANELQTRLSEESAKLQSSFEAARAALESARERRDSSIPRMHKLIRKKVLEEIDENEGRRKHKLQTETLQSRRDREQAMASAEKTFEEFKGNLAAMDNALCFLEQSARGLFQGFGRFLGFLSAPPSFSSQDIVSDEYELIQELQNLLEGARSDLDRFRGFVLPRFFKHRWIWLLMLLSLIPLAPFIQFDGIRTFSFGETSAFAGVVFFACVVLHFFGKHTAGPLAAEIARSLGRARQLHSACAEKSVTRYQQELERVEAEFQSVSEQIDPEWRLALNDAAAMRVSQLARIDEKAARIAGKNKEIFRLKVERLGRDLQVSLESLKSECATRTGEVAKASARNEAKLNADYETEWGSLEADWKQKTRPLWQTIDAANANADKSFPTWDSHFCENWTPPTEFKHAVKFARLDVEVEKLACLPKDKRLSLPGASQLSVPLLLVHPNQGSILFETSDSGREQALGVLNNIVLRLLSVAPPGRLVFTVVDPVGLGQSFSGVMHLADYAEHLIHSRIWTQSGQIEQKLAELNEHMEKVIQMYLRNEYATIAEYNEQAGNIAEKYHFLVVADFPANFSETAAKRLLSIATSGARCGVFTLIHWDRRQSLPQDFIVEELRKNSVCVQSNRSTFLLAGMPGAGTNLILDSPPAQEFASGFIHKVGLSSRDSNRVEVPFSQVTPSESEIWTHDTTAELRVPIGRAGATKLQFLAIGKDTRQHGLIAGKTGSGKSTLFHVIITNLSLWCSPDHVEFYLVDFKKGVEFKCYAAKRLPHARVVAIESDREFGLSVLQRVDDELRRRGELFRNLGVQNLEGYKKAGGARAIPRSLLMIDEFQEFFVEDDRISQSASVLLDRIVRQGRAFGIHVLLGSQTLGGAYTMARSTLGQMVIRIALQCNEADAYLIMDDDNPAPRLLSRPGEGIYNDNGGALEGNSPFQTVWLPDEVRDNCLDQVRRQADRNPTAYREPIVFEGNAPADVRENALLGKLLNSESVQPADSARIWLGAPNSIKGPTEVVFSRQSGNHLLIVGQRDEAILSILSVALVSLAAQYPVGRARFVLVEGTPPDSPQREFFGRVVRAIPHEITHAKSGDLPTIMNGLASEMKTRSGDEHFHDAAATFLFIHDLQKHHKLRYEEDFGFSTGDAEEAVKPGAQLNDLICGGSGLGFHVVAACDTYNNVNRFLSRKAVTEFEMRVLFQMSANDSASLIDSPKAGSLGLHRALFYNEQEGYLETFRPYALPDGEWVGEAARNLERLLKPM